MQTRITSTHGDGGCMQEGEGLLNSFVRRLEFFLARKELLGENLELRYGSESHLIKWRC